MQWTSSGSWQQKPFRFLLRISNTQTALKSAWVIRHKPIHLKLIHLKLIHLKLIHLKLIHLKLIHLKLIHLKFIHFKLMTPFRKPPSPWPWRPRETTSHGKVHQENQKHQTLTSAMFRSGALSPAPPSHPPALGTSLAPQGDTNANRVHQPPPLGVKAGSAEHVFSLLRGGRGLACPHFPKYTTAGVSTARRKYPSRLGFFHASSPKGHISYLETAKFCAACLDQAVPSGYNYWSMVPDGNGSVKGGRWLDTAASSQTYPRLYQSGTERFDKTTVSPQSVPEHLLTSPKEVPIPKVPGALDAWRWLQAQQKPFYLDGLHLTNGSTPFAQLSVEEDSAIVKTSGEPYIAGRSTHAADSQVHQRHVEEGSVVRPKSLQAQRFFPDGFVPSGKPNESAAASTVSLTISKNPAFGTASTSSIKRKAVPARGNGPGTLPASATPPVQQRAVTSPPGLPQPPVSRPEAIHHDAVTGKTMSPQPKAHFLDGSRSISQPTSVFGVDAGQGPHVLVPRNTAALDPPDRTKLPQGDPRFLQDARSSSAISSPQSLSSPTVPMRGAKTPQEVAPSLDRGSSGGNQPISRTSVRSQTGEPTKPALPVLGPKPSDKSKDGRKEQPTSDATAGQVPQDKPTARSSQPRKAESSSQVGRDTLPNSDRTRFARNWYRHDPIDFDELDGPSSPPAEQTPDTRSEETPGTPLPLPRILPQPRSSKTDATDYKLAATAVAELFRLLQSPPEGKSRAKRTLSLPEASNRGSLERSSGVGEPAIHQERQVTKPSKKSKMPQMMSGIPETMSSVAYDTSSMPQKVPYAIQTRSRPPKISNAPQTVSGVPPVVSNVPQTASDAMQKAPSRPPKITNAPRVVSGVSQTMSSAPQKIKMPSVPRKISGQAGSQAMPSIPPQKRRTHEVVEEMPPSPANQLTVTDRSIAKKPSPARPLRSAPTSSQYPVVPSHQPQDTRSLGAAGSKTKSAGPAPKHATGAEKKDAVRSVVDTWRQKTASGSKANPDRGSKAPKPSTVKVADGKVKTKRTAPRAEPRKRRVGDTKKIPGAEKKRKSHPKDPGSLRVPGKEKRGGRSSLGHGKPGAHDTHTTTKISSMSNSTTNCPIYLLGGGSRDSDSDSDVENDDDMSDSDYASNPFQTSDLDDDEPAQEGGPNQSDTEDAANASQDGGPGQDSAQDSRPSSPEFPPGEHVPNPPGQSALTQAEAGRPDSRISLVSQPSIPDVSVPNPSLGGTQQPGTAHDSPRQSWSADQDASDPFGNQQTSVSSGPYMEPPFDTGASSSYCSSPPWLGQTLAADTPQQHSPLEPIGFENSRGLPEQGQTNSTLPNNSQQVDSVSSWPSGTIETAPLSSTDQHGYTAMPSAPSSGNPRVFDGSYYPPPSFVGDQSQASFLTRQQASVLPSGTSRGLSRNQAQAGADSSGQRNFEMGQSGQMPTSVPEPAPTTGQPAPLGQPGSPWPTATGQGLNASYFSEAPYTSAEAAYDPYSTSLLAPEKHADPQPDPWTASRTGNTAEQTSPWAPKQYEPFSPSSPTVPVPSFSSNQAWDQQAGPPATFGRQQERQPFPGDQSLGTDPSEWNSRDKSVAPTDSWDPNATRQSSPAPYAAQGSQRAPYGSYQSPPRNRLYALGDPSPQRTGGSNKGKILLAAAAGAAVGIGAAALLSRSSSASSKSSHIQSPPPGTDVKNYAAWGNVPASNDGFPYDGAYSGSEKAGGASSSSSSSPSSSSSSGHGNRDDPAQREAASHDWNDVDSDDNQSGASNDEGFGMRDDGDESDNHSVASDQLTSLSYDNENAPQAPSVSGASDSDQAGWYDGDGYGSAWNDEENHDQGSQGSDRSQAGEHDMYGSDQELAYNSEPQGQFTSGSDQGSESEQEYMVDDEAVHEESPSSVAGSDHYLEQSGTEQDESGLDEEGEDCIGHEIVDESDEAEGYGEEEQDGSQEDEYEIENDGEEEEEEEESEEEEEEEEEESEEDESEEEEEEESEDYAEEYDEGGGGSDSDAYSY
ncbi:hypothetical protein CH063_01647 [Colletotrichum higginsianum]|uniref:Uncharacterized protein n=1 Tax=Colletotrichum higginsianum (strain IMI 349063) TaxID=759273 RepID=H1VAC8_COLHI|nr:hypothetical protein CH063_01647 [Colletotrichum higginsianum]